MPAEQRLIEKIPQLQQLKALSKALLPLEVEPTLRYLLPTNQATSWSVSLSKATSKIRVE